MARNTWTRRDDFEAYLVKRGLMTEDEWLETRPTFSRATLIRKILNYGYLNGENNYEGVSRQARDIYRMYHRRSDEVLRFVWENGLWNI